MLYYNLTLTVTVMELKTTGEQTTEYWKAVKQWTHGKGVDTIEVGEKLS